jgi:hypothetical protein
MTRIWPALLPELRRFPEGERAQALHAARETQLDTVELVGMAIGLVAVTAFTKYSVSDHALAPRFAMAVLNFVVALPLLVVVLGPFHLRRLRRGLRDQLRLKDGRP